MRWEDIPFNSDLSNTVIWQIMGYYPKRITVKTAGIIHEYRSRSVGRFGVLKDFSKKYLVPKPNFRLFQTEYLRKTFERNDGVPSGILGLGVPEALSPTLERKAFLYDFGYVGQVSDERKLGVVIDAFLAAYGDSQSLCLIGPVRDGIDERYKSHRNIKFTGKLPQEEALSLVRQCQFGLAYFPYHMPHTHQPPTKLYEYAAMGMPVIANDAPGNLNAIQQFGIEAFVSKGIVFPALSELSHIKDNSAFDPTALHWNSLIHKSGIEHFLQN